MAEVPFPYRVGRLSRPHGLRGEVVAQLFRRRDHAADPKRQRWLPLKPPLAVEIEDRTEALERLTVTHVRWLDPIRVVLRVAELTDRDHAEARIGAYLDIDPARLNDALHDEVDRCFEAEVRHAETGELLGEVFAIRDNGAQALLEIELAADGSMALVPYVPAFVEGVEAEGDSRVVRIRPIPGLLEG